MTEYDMPICKQHQREAELAQSIAGGVSKR